MKLRVGLIEFCAVICVAASDGGSCEDGATVLPPVNWKHVAVKFEAIESRLQRMESMQMQLQKNIEDKIQEHQEQIIAALKTDRSSQDQRQNEMFTAIRKLDRDFQNVHNITRQIMNALPQMLQITAKVSPTVDYNSVVTPTEVRVPQPTTTTTSTTTTTTKPKPMQTVDGSSCKNVASNGSGTHVIRVTNESEPFKVYCEQNSFGDGWIVFQYRYDGSLDFYRGWSEFRDGFGDLNKEFWLGLEKVYQITSSRKHELIIELKDFSGTYKYARYDEFEIGNEIDQYNLKKLGKYSGTAGDEMSHNKGRKFSTKDRDNDGFISDHCAQLHEGAWWHWYCTSANLNGRYMNADSDISMYWIFFHNSYQGLSYSRMMIREVE